MVILSTFRSHVRPVKPSLSSTSRGIGLLVRGIMLGAHGKSTGNLGWRCGRDFICPPITLNDAGGIKVGVSPFWRLFAYLAGIIFSEHQFFSIKARNSANNGVESCGPGEASG